MTEHWINIPGFEGIYFASNLGKVKNVLKDKILVPHLHKKGHVSIRLRMHGKVTTFYLKNLILGIFSEFQDLPISFKNGDHLDCSFNNLFYVKSLIKDEIPASLLNNGEQWKTSPSSPLLIVSNHGRVYSKETYVQSKGGWRLKRGRLLKLHNDFDGYRTLRFQEQNYKVHRLVMEAFLGQSSFPVNHINGKKDDNRLSNLEYTSLSSNSHHAFKIGLNKRKFSESDKAKILQLFEQGLSRNAIAKEFKSTPETIRKLVPPFHPMEKRTRQRKNISPHNSHVPHNQLADKSNSNIHESYSLQVQSLEGEEWREIPILHRYLASNLGRIKSVRRVIQEKGSSKQQTRAEKILRPGKDSFGYLRVRLFNKDGIGNTYKIHRLVLWAFKGFQDLDCNHIDGNKQNNKLDNLQYCTHIENIRHANQNGLIKNIEKGSQRYNAKLTEKDVMSIIQREKNQQATCKELSLEFKVSYRCIKSITRGISWKHVFNLYQSKTTP